MDNASKALIMAGAVFITILLISLMIYTVTQIRDYNEASSTQTLNTQIEAFNRFYVYSKPADETEKIKGSEVCNIICKSIDINQGWSAQKIKITYLNNDYTNKDASEVKAMFLANNKALAQEDFYYNYKLSNSTGMVEEVIFTN